CARGDWEFAYW
nr:immunoglobulin heavy chain junction region [Mus musculus]